MTIKEDRAKEDGLRVRMMLTVNQARFVMRACEMMSRLQMGQWEELVWEFMDPERHGKDFQARRVFVRKELDVIEKVIWPMMGYWDGLNEKETERKNVNWLVYTAIRNALAWYFEPEGDSMCVSFDPPFNETNEPTPDVVIAEVVGNE